MISKLRRELIWGGSLDETPRRDEKKMLLRLSAYRSGLRLLGRPVFRREYTLLTRSPTAAVGEYGRSVRRSRSRGVVTAPTLGPQADPYTKLTNPFKDEQGAVLRVKVSEAAAQQLNSIKENDQNPDQVLRVAVESGGCHGFQYLLSLKSSADIDLENDSIFERDGAKVVIDQTSLEVLQDSTIDYTTELIGSQFKVVDSPYATSSCGCGSSFAFDPSKKR